MEPVAGLSLRIEPPARSPGPTSSKLSYKQQRELEQLPAKLEALELEQNELAEAISRPEFYERGAAEQARVQARLAELAAELAAAYARWEGLETRR